MLLGDAVPGIHYIVQSKPVTCKSIDSLVPGDTIVILHKVRPEDQSVLVTYGPDNFESSYPLDDSAKTIEVVPDMNWLGGEIAKHSYLGAALNKLRNEYYREGY